MKKFKSVNKTPAKRRTYPTANISPNQNTQSNQVVQDMVTSQKDETASKAAEVNNSNCQNCVLWDEIDALKESLLEKEDEVSTLKNQLSEYTFSEEKSKKRLLNSDQEADKLLKTAMYKYHTELKTVKLLADKIRESYKEELSSCKAELTDLISDLLNDIDKEGLLSSSQKAQELLQKAFPEEAIREKEDSEREAFYGDDYFDLDKALNPDEDLDLKALLGELGVFGENEQGNE